MTEGENKAIEYLKGNALVRLNENNEIVAYGNAHKYYIINLIEKLQKENEELQKENELRREDYIALHKMYNNKCVDIMELEENSLTIKQVKENFIPKDKIREIINEDLPDDEICEVCEKYDVNGVVIKQKLIKVLEEE